MNIFANYTAAFLITVSIAKMAVAEEWGNLSGRFGYDGKPPEMKQFELYKAKEFTADLKVFDESLVVGKDGGIKDVVIWVRNKDIPVHDDYVKNRAKMVTVEIRGSRYEPHVAKMQTGQNFQIKSFDPVGYNSNPAFIANQGFSRLIPVNAMNDFGTIREAEAAPVEIRDNIFPWMRGWLVVKPHPYVAISSADGKFAMQNLPVGTWEFQVWQESVGYVKKVIRDGKPTEWSRGRFTLEIKPGDNNLGEIKWSL